MVLNDNTFALTIPGSISGASANLTARSIAIGNTGSLNLTNNARLAAAGLLSVRGDITVAAGAGALEMTGNSIAIGSLNGRGVTLQASKMLVTSTKATTIADGATIWTDGDTFTRPATGLAPISPAFDSPGAHIQVGPEGFQQDGLLTVKAYSSFTIHPVLDIRLAAGVGTIVLDPPNLVSGPTMTLILHVGGGNATGNLNADSLAIFYTSLNGLPTVLNGTLHTIGGLAVSDSSAASQAFVGLNGTYVPSNQFQMNGCAVSSVNCVLVSSIQQIPILNPFKDIEIGRSTDRFDDPELLLPNVSDRDY